MMILIFPLSPDVLVPIFQILKINVINNQPKYGTLGFYLISCVSVALKHTDCHKSKRSTFQSSGLQYKVKNKIEDIFESCHFSVICNKIGLGYISQA